MQAIRPPDNQYEQFLAELAHRYLAELRSASRQKQMKAFRQFLKSGQNFLRTLHRRPGFGRLASKARSYLADLLIDFSLRIFCLEPDFARSRFAVVALGGYGREELCPGSDLDVMFLYDCPSIEKSGFHRLFEGSLLYELFPRVSPVVRTIEDCLHAAAADLRSKTALIESRFVWGDRELFEDFQASLIDNCVKGHEEEYLRQRLEDQQVRRQKYGNSYSLQEPNIKNGCGGLRDFQNLYWMAFFKYRVRNLEELLNKNLSLIDKEDLKQLNHAYDFLLRVRTELHYLTGRCTDILRRVWQPKVAWRLGYKDRSPAKRISLFMTDYFRATRTIFLIARDLEFQLAPALSVQDQNDRRLVLGTAQKATWEERGVDLKNGRLEVSDESVFWEDPRQTIQIFRLAQQLDVPLGPQTMQRIRRSLCKMDASLRQDPTLIKTFLEILRHRGNIGQILRAMHETNFLGKFLPAFSRLTGLVQLEFYHLHAADEHALRCLETFDEIARSSTGEWAEFHEIYHQIFRPEILHLAALLHDAGRTKQVKDHIEASSKIAASVARRLKLDAEAQHMLRFLIENHLEMVRTCERKDLSQPDVIHRFARLVENKEQLKMLLLLTVADIRATSPSLWTGYRRTLLQDLYRRTIDFLEKGESDVEAIRQRIRTQVLRSAPWFLSKREIIDHLEGLPERYLVARPPESIILDLILVRHFIRKHIFQTGKPLEPVLYWRDLPECGYAELFVCAWDRPGLFSDLTACITAAEMNIHSAEIFTRQDHIVIDSFKVTDMSTGLLPLERQKKKCCTLMRKVINQKLDAEEVLRMRSRKTRNLEEDIGVYFKPRVEILNYESKVYTVVEVRCADHPGLLHQITKAFHQMGWNIGLAKVNTDRGMVWDVFYVTDSDGKKIEDASQIERAKRWLFDVLKQKKEEGIAESTSGS